MATLYDPKKSPIANLKVLLRALGDINTRGSLDETAARLAILTSNRAVAGSSSVVKADDFTAEAGGRYAVNTTDAAVTALLPATPAAGDTVTLSDAAGTFDTNNLTIDANGGNIDSSASDLVSAAVNAQIELCYINSTIGWKAFYTAAATGSTAITGTLSATGVATFSDATDATSSTAAGTIVSGGLAVAKKLYVGTAAVIGTTLNVVGATTLAALSATTGAFSGLLTATGGLVGGVQALSGAGAVNLTTVATDITSTGADALTLANGTNGQIKVLTMIVDGGAATLTPTTKTGFTTLTFDDVGDSAMIQYHTTLGWMLIGTPTATAA